MPKQLQQHAQQKHRMYVINSAPVGYHVQQGKNLFRALTEVYSVYSLNFLPSEHIHYKNIDYPYLNVYVNVSNTKRLPFNSFW